MVLGTLSIDDERDDDDDELGRERTGPRTSFTAEEFKTLADSNLIMSQF